MTPFLFVFCLVFFWVGLTILLSWIATRPEGVTRSGLPDYDADNVQKTGLCLIISTVISVLTVAFVLPIIFHIDTTGATQWIHHVGVVVLGMFLAVALYLQLEIWMKFHICASMESVRRSYQHWRGFTEFAPAPAAIMILLSGLGRLYARAGYSIGRGWIFTLVLVLALMMSDGIFGYTYDVRRLLHAADIAVRQSQGVIGFTQTTRNRGRDVKLFLHSLSFPFVIVFPALKLFDESSPASPLLRSLKLVDRAGWSQVWPALVLFAIPFLIVAALNRFGRPMLSKSIHVSSQG